jgi:hypothetical protein
MVKKFPVFYRTWIYIAILLHNLVLANVIKMINPLKTCIHIQECMYGNAPQQFILYI